jgi:hypothetical protein
MFLVETDRDPGSTYSITIEYLTVQLQVRGKPSPMRYITPTRYSCEVRCTYNYKVHLHLGGTLTSTKYSTLYLHHEMQPHLRGTSIHTEVQLQYNYKVLHLYTDEVHLYLPTTYIYSTTTPSWNSLLIRYPLRRF